jgi:SWIM zinc finger
MNWTTEQILSLAPDASSAKSGQSLAAPRHWQKLGCNENIVWGLCQGSGKDPYQIQIDLSEPAFRCSCPSRKFPCKHSLGLFLLLAAQPKTFVENEPPAWVKEWLESRRERTAKRNEKQAKEASEVKVVDPAAQAKRAQQRESRVTAGLQELELWLRDLIRNGLASAQTAPPQFWERPAARLVDAQAPGLARIVREMAGVAVSGSGWQSRLLERAGLLYLLIEGFKRIDTLPAEIQVDIRTSIGWTQNQDELLREPGIRDDWLVGGRRVFEEDKLRVQRTWLWGRTSNQTALVLHFAHSQQPLDTSLVPGTMIEAELVFFPSAFPLRALVKERCSSPVSPVAFDGMQFNDDIACVMAAHSAVLASNPWNEIFPVSLKEIIPTVRREGEREFFLVQDANGNAMMISPRFVQGWELLALGGGHSISLFGEWDGHHLWPLGVISEGRFVNMA